MKRKKETTKKQKGKRKKLNKKMTFAELLKKHPEAAEALFENGMHCAGCPAAMHETIEMGAEAHGLDPDGLMIKLNKKIKKR